MELLWCKAPRAVYLNPPFQEALGNPFKTLV